MGEMEETAARCAKELESALRDDPSFVEIIEDRAQFIEGNSTGLTRLAIASLRAVSKDFDEVIGEYPIVGKDQGVNLETSAAPTWDTIEGIYLNEDRVVLEEADPENDVSPEEKVECLNEQFDCIIQLYSLR